MVEVVELQVELLKIVLVETIHLVEMVELQVVLLQIALVETIHLVALSLPQQF